MPNILLALSYAFCWGVGATLTKLALSGIAAAPLLVIQLFSSVLFLFSLYYVKHRRSPITSSSLKLGFAGVFEPALAYMIGIFGLKMTTASNATLIGASEVILTILLAAMVLGEPLTRAKILLAITSFSGIFLLMLRDTSGGTQGSLLGDLLVLLGTVFAVFYVLLSKKQIGTVKPLQLIAAQQWVGLLATILGFTVLSLADSSYRLTLSGIPLQFWLLAVISGVLQYALAFLLYLIALRTVPVSHAAFYVALIPVFGVVSAMMLLGEQPNAVQWVGAVLIIVSAYWGSRLEVHQEV